MPAGGYQRPSNPAPVSGPGAASKRTDGGPVQKLQELPDAQYGEAATFRDLQQAAPLSQSPSPRSRGGGTGAGRSAPAFGAPTGRPDQPITAGLGGEQASADAQVQAEDLERLKKYLPALMEMAGRADATPSFRNYVRLLRSRVR